MGAPRASAGAGDVHTAAAHGTSGAGGALPHFDQIQRSFGRHDVGQIQAHVGGAAAEGASAMGAEAFATGNHVAFARSPDLHTAAHEAAHVVQQRGGVSLKGGVGEEGDPHERHADAVADAVVAGGSAEALLDQYASGASPGQTAEGAADTQRKAGDGSAVQLRGNKAVDAYKDTQLDNPFTDAHIFEGEVDGNDPKGLHAYHGGKAGQNVEVLKTIGNTNSVHVIIWTKGAAKNAQRAKWSSMFPQNMHKGIAAGTSTTAPAPSTAPARSTGSGQAGRPSRSGMQATPLIPRAGPTGRASVRSTTNPRSGPIPTTMSPTRSRIPEPTSGALRALHG
jgi:hypothetical protein